MNRPVIPYLTDTSQVTYPKVKTGITFRVTTLASFPFIHTFLFFTYKNFWFSDISAFRFFACEGVERPEEGRQSLGCKKEAARQRCLKHVREINNSNKNKRERGLFVNQGIRLCFSHRKIPESECCCFLRLYPINKHEAR